MKPSHQKKQQRAGRAPLKTFLLTVLAYQIELYDPETQRRVFASKEVYRTKRQALRAAADVKRRLDGTRSSRSIARTALKREHASHRMQHPHQEKPR